ncbi:MAG: hypothetical protein KatS3mg003_0044 [Candidatus Nitrosocaldaceae archaeon]|nr:MAG: hypothetical protein KatS3mg003_0044 [Candidatus Nitrosocaldaceae archaeon]
MRILAISNNAEKLLSSCFGVLYKLSKKHEIHILLTDGTISLDFARIHYINKQAQLQLFIAELTNLIDNLDPILVFIPKDAPTLTHAALIASRNVKNVLLYTKTNKYANIIVNISDIYDQKSNILKNKLEKEEFFISYKFMLDKWWLV